MTEVEFGGGASIELRRKFCAPKDGAQMPGYTGHVHGLDFHIGHTYGESSHLLAQTYEFRNPITETTEPIDRPQLQNELPDPTGDNKYTKNMVPGYTGYIPKLLYKFGGTYKNDCDVSIDRHISAVDCTQEKERYLRHMVKIAPRQQVLNHDPLVRDHLNTYRDTHPLPPILAEARRAPLEAPICSWKGYVPRIPPTDVGLGLCYRDASARALKKFNHETTKHHEIMKLPVNVRCCPSSVPEVDHPVSRRIYLNDGMIPKYTGWVPDKKYEFGLTYGDATRVVEVCSHNKEYYGQHTRTRGPRPTIVVS